MDSGCTAAAIQAAWGNSGCKEGRKAGGEAGCKRLQSEDESKQVGAGAICGAAHRCAAFAGAACFQLLRRRKGPHTEYLHTEYLHTDVPCTEIPYTEHLLDLSPTAGRRIAKRSLPKFARICKRRPRVRHLVAPGFVSAAQSTLDTAPRSAMLRLPVAHGASPRRWQVVPNPNHEEKINE